MARQKTAINAIGGVVYRQVGPGEVELLLLKKRGGYWTLPKGHVEGDERPIDAVVREIQEETGLTGSVELFVREVSYYIVKKGKLRRKVVSYYLFCADPGVPRPAVAEGIEHVRWFPSKTALARIRRSRVRAVARRAMKLLKLPATCPNQRGQLST